MSCCLLWQVAWRRIYASIWRLASLKAQWTMNCRRPSATICICGRCPWRRGRDGQERRTVSITHFSVSISFVCWRRTGPCWKEASTTVRSSGFLSAISLACGSSFVSFFPLSVPTLFSGFRMEFHWLNLLLHHPFLITTNKETSDPHANDMRYTPKWSASLPRSKRLGRITAAAAPVLLRRRKSMTDLYNTTTPFDSDNFSTDSASLLQLLTRPPSLDSVGHSLSAHNPVFINPQRWSGSTSCCVAVLSILFVFRPLWVSCQPTWADSSSLFFFVTQ